jgi:cytochrome c553
MKNYNAIIISLILTVSNLSFALTTPSGFDISKCTKCHTENPDGGYHQFPRLAGQTLNYLMSSTYSYKNHMRHTFSAERLMSKRVQIDGKIIYELATYFNQLKPQPGIASDPIQTELGKEIYHNGIPDKDVMSCAACHGKFGEGKVKGRIARLAGQYLGYTWNQLRSYKNGEIDEAAEMSEAAKDLTEDEMKAVSTYIQSLNGY